MTTAKQNEVMTQTCAGTPGGALLRSYWQPAALSEELAAGAAAHGRPLVPVRLLGEDLVLFRDAEGRLGLIERRCPHRGVDLAFGRLEDGGLRCPFHGWLFDVAGHCLEQPAEGADSRAHRHLTHRAYPCVEQNGVIFAYLGPGAPPALPAFDCFAAPLTHTFAFKGLWECNWLQAQEVGIDPAHASFLHRFLADARDPAYGRQFRSHVGDTQIPLTQVLREHPCPSIKIEDTGYGFRLITTRTLAPDSTHYRITNLLFPNAIAIPMSSEMTITQWHVPIDDTHCYWYAIFVSFAAPVDQDTLRRQRLAHHALPDYRPLQGRLDGWGYDPREQQTQTYTGMGHDTNVHDQWAVESPGPVHDRTREHLGRSDIGIIRYRKLLLAAIEAVQSGGRAPFALDEATARALTGPVAIDAIGPVASATACWQLEDQARREQCPWLRQAARQGLS